MAIEDTRPLVLDLVEWVARTPRTHAELLDVWRTSCPRLTVWEDAVEAGLVARGYDPTRGAIVTVTAKGREVLAESGRLVEV